MSQLAEPSAGAHIASFPRDLSGTNPPARPDRSSSRLDRWLAAKLLESLGNPNFRMALWDGREVGPSAAEPEWRIHIRDRVTLRKLALDPLYQFGEAYSSAHLEVEGELTDFLTMINRKLQEPARRKTWMSLLMRWVHWPRSNSLTGSRDNIYHHYDISNDFYRLWLDRQMVYTCAYFPDPDCTLEEAQIAKLDHVCRKLQLKPGQQVVEAGCGWGALALHMARHYGVSVKAFNISREQLAFARERARAEGLADRVEYIEDDWRNIRHSCDAFVSVGMLEHVGVRNYHELGEVIFRNLRPTGRGLIHSIGQNYPQPFNPWIERRIFPGAYPPSLREFMSIFEPRDFSVLDVENLRLHYAQTIRHWLTRFDQAGDQVDQMFGPKFVRMWRLYLAGSIAAFDSGALQLFQVVFAPGASNEVPMTRAHLYSFENVRAADTAAAS